MKVESDKQVTPAEVQAIAEAWFRRQVEIASMALGCSWGEHTAHVIDHLRRETGRRGMVRVRRRCDD